MDNAAAANSQPHNVTDYHDNQHANAQPVFPRSNLQVTIANILIMPTILSCIVHDQIRRGRVWSSLPGNS